MYKFKIGDLVKPRVKDKWQIGQIKDVIHNSTIGINQYKINNFYYFEDEIDSVEVS